MPTDSISILDGNKFVVSDRRGDIEGTTGSEQGLFSDDTRFLSRCVLTVDGRRPNVLSIDDTRYYAVQFFMALTAGTIYVDSHLSVVRRRSIGEGFREQISLINHGAEEMDVVVKLELAADFADLFEVKDKLEKKGELYHRAEAGRMVLGYRRDTFRRETWIVPSEQAEISEDGLEFRVHLPPHGTWETTVDVMAIRRPNKQQAPAPFKGGGGLRADLEQTVHRWIETAPQLVSSWEPLQKTYDRSLVDLAALRFVSPMLPDAPMPAAGLPWFMALFGRDSLITSYQALPFKPELASTTLRLLGALQARTLDPFRDSEPGKILHELRLGD